MEENYLLKRPNIGALEVFVGNRKSTLRDVLSQAAAAGLDHVLFTDGSGLTDDIAEPIGAADLERHLEAHKYVSNLIEPLWWGRESVLSRQGDGGWSYECANLRAFGVGESFKLVI